MASYRIYKFIGEDGSLGYQSGKTYCLLIENKIDIFKFKFYPVILSFVENPRGACPYESWNAFWRNWHIPENTVEIKALKKLHRP